MAGDAAFPEGGVLEQEGPGLFPMTGGARFVQTGHGQAPGRLEKVGAVRVVALDAIHLSVNDRMMMGHVEFSQGVLMALETGGGIPAWIHDELPRPSALDMFAAGAVARFAPGPSGPPQILLVKEPVRAGRKNGGDFGVAIGASGIANQGGSLDLGREKRGLRGGGARAEE
jgi:hypothetical protein